MIIQGHLCIGVGKINTVMDVLLKHSGFLFIRVSFLAFCFP